ncbi:hypothetical protein Adu01nite_27410 [Paractinoplanes durhamensis]|uniref:Uncharacterized protein n=1 Tax=Paractinoplanes durhamensis TaxID=113563 RepID=A0ABQ3YUW9_9ACTN|nr:hypothetical protein Adu01nite_27410 [Actinoplanes durhamensis]
MPGGTGRSPSWSIQAARRVNQGWTWFQALAVAVPYRLVAVLVVTAGAGQVAGRPVSCGDQAFDDATDLDRSLLGDVVGRSEPPGVEDRDPRGRS